MDERSISEKQLLDACSSASNNTCVQLLIATGDFSIFCKMMQERNLELKGELL